MGKKGGGAAQDTSGMEEATRESIALQKEMYESGQELMQPWYETGVTAKDRMSMLMGLEGDPTAAGYGTMAQPFGMEQFQADPGYQFRLSEGEKAIKRGAASRGQYFDPSAAKALTGYGQELASGEYASAADRYAAEQSGLYSRLAGLAGYGQTAYGQQVGAGQQYAGQVGGLTTGLANAQAAAAQAAASRKTSMFGSLLGAGATVAGAYFGGPAGAAAGSSAASAFA